MNDNQIALASLSMDLKRVAMGYHRGSIVVAKRFFEEALERRKEISKESIKPYLQKLLDSLDNLILQKDNQKIAEDALMYSTLFQNAASNRGCRNDPEIAQFEKRSSKIGG